MAARCPAALPATAVWGLRPCSFSSHRTAHAESRKVVEADAWVRYADARSRGEATAAGRSSDMRTRRRAESRTAGFESKPPLSAPGWPVPCAPANGIGCSCQPSLQRPARPTRQPAGCSAQALSMTSTAQESQQPAPSDPPDDKRSSALRSRTEASRTDRSGAFARPPLARGHAPAVARPRGTQHRSRSQRPPTRPRLGQPAPSRHLQPGRAPRLRARPTGWRSQLPDVPLRACPAARRPDRPLARPPPASRQPAGVAGSETRANRRGHRRAVRAFGPSPAPFHDSFEKASHPR